MTKFISIDELLPVLKSAQAIHMDGEPCDVVKDSDAEESGQILFLEFNGYGIAFYKKENAQVEVNGSKVTLISRYDGKQVIEILTPHIF